MRGQPLAVARSQCARTAGYFVLESPTRTTLLTTRQFLGSALVPADGVGFGGAGEGPEGTGPGSPGSAHGHGSDPQ